MLFAYVSDERYVALADVLVDLEQEGELVATCRSTATGALWAEVEPGEYRLSLVRQGFGSKRVEAQLTSQVPLQLRLLSDMLMGYMWPKWVKSGKRAEFRVHSVEAYHLSLWRYGLTKELVRPLGWFDEHGPRAAMQITPDGDYTQTGVNWNQVGYSSPHHTQFAEAPERSGLYYLHAKTSAGAFFSFPWIVAPKRPTARIAVLCNTMTANAYNRFGGRSNYVCATGLPERPTVNARQDLPRYGGGSFAEWGAPDDDYLPLSFERPEPLNHIAEDTVVSDPIVGRDACHTCPVDWRLLAWLEREGYEYDLYAENQLHAGELPLEEYRILILDAHPEYWTREMYVLVKKWVWEKGGRLMYLGGNGLNCEVDILPDGAMRCKSMLLSTGGDLGMEDPDRPGVRYESRMHRTLENEAGLLGVVCTEAGIMTAAPFKTVHAEHWALAGTGLREGDLFGEACLQERVPGGASGHETDKMSAFSPPGTTLIAKGTNPDEGGSEMVTYETPSGGAVFSVGSITYIPSLLVDVSVSRITRNVIERFLRGIEVRAGKREGEGQRT